MMPGGSLFFQFQLLLFAWLPASRSCKPQLSLLMYFAIWCTNKSDKYPQLQKGPLATASYAARHPSFHDHIMCTHMKHVWLRGDELHSIVNGCAEMGQGQTILHCGLYWNSESLMLGAVFVPRYDPSYVLWESLIIKTRLLESEWQHILHYL